MLSVILPQIKRNHRVIKTFHLICDITVHVLCYHFNDSVTEYVIVLLFITNRFLEKKKKK